MEKITNANYYLEGANGEREEVDKQKNAPATTSQTQDQPAQDATGAVGTQEQSNQPKEKPTFSNIYGDITGNKSEYSPNSEGKGNTGQGAEAAVGTEYSWNKQASNQAQKTYSNDVLTAKQNALNNRQTIENNAVNYQAQADMMKYQNNQNAEKVGWTGGYVLDQNRQMDYLKASIQAQMYGAMELQKYGYDSALAAARLSYDLNQQEYARQYYNDAVSAALSEAQMTGVYFSAETKDMMSQMAVADQNLIRIGALDKDGNPIDGFDPDSLSPEDRAAYDQATKVKDSINGWFSTNGISKEGVKTLEAWQQDQANEFQWAQEMYVRYDAALKAANSKLAEDSNMFIWLDENGNEVWDGVNVKTGNWETMTGQKIIDYVKDNATATNQFYGYLDSTLTGTVESGFKKWCISKGYISEDKDGNIKLGKNVTSLNALLNQYINQSGLKEQYASKFAGIDEDVVNELFGQWEFTFQMPDGNTETMTYSDLIKQSGNTTIDPNKDYQTLSGSYTVNGNTYNYNWSVASGTTDRTGYNGSNYYTTYLSNGKAICLTTAGRMIKDDYVEEVGDKIESLMQQGYSYSEILAASLVGEKKNELQVNGKPLAYYVNSFDGESDIDVHVYEGDSHTYNQEIGSGEIGKYSDKQTERQLFHEIEELYKATNNGKEPEHGAIIVIAGKSWCYNKYSKCWSGIKTQCDRSSPLKSALKDSGQWVD